MATKRDSISGTNSNLLGCISSLEVDAVGIANSDKWRATRLEEQVLKLLPSAHSLVVLAMEIYPEVLDLAVPEHVMGTAPIPELLNRHIYYLGERLAKAAYNVARVSRRTGFKALPLPSLDCPIDRKSKEAVLSYMDAAQAAGLGHVGMNGLLVSPQFGPRIQLAVCLTEVTLLSTAEVPVACRSCNTCVSKCPSGALAWPENDEPYVLNKLTCQTYQNATGGCFEGLRQHPVQSPIYRSWGDSS